MTHAAAPLFENAAWAVHADGLEHKGNGYFIGRGQIGDRDPDGFWAWPVHMAEKAWCAPDAFAEAFLRALAAFGIARDARLAASFSAPRLGAGDAPAWRRIARHLGFEEAPAAAPILVEARRRPSNARAYAAEGYGRGVLPARAGRGEGARRTA